MRLGFLLTAGAALVTANQCATLRAQESACARFTNNQEGCQKAKCEFEYTDGTATTGTCKSPVIYEGLKSNDADADTVAYDYWDFTWREPPQTTDADKDRFPNGFRRGVMHEHNNPPFCLNVPDTRNTEVKVMVESTNPNARLCIVSQEYDELATLNPTALMKRCDFGQVTACFPANVEGDLKLMIYCEDSCPEGETAFWYQVFHSDKRSAMQENTVGTTTCNANQKRKVPCGYRPNTAGNAYEKDESGKPIADSTYMTSQDNYCCPKDTKVYDSAVCSAAPAGGCTTEALPVHRAEFCCQVWGFSNAAEDVVDMWCMLLDGAETKTGGGNGISQLTAAKLQWPSEYVATSLKDMGADQVIPTFQVPSGAMSAAPGAVLLVAVFAAFFA